MILIDLEMVKACDPTLYIECIVGPCYVKNVPVDCGYSMNVISYSHYFTYIILMMTSKLPTTLVEDMIHM